MKNAALWKRVLNGGVACHSPDVATGKLADLTNEIVSAPIIVDARARDVDAEENQDWRWSEYTRLVLPFASFWVEGVAIGRSLHMFWGALVRSKPSPDGWDVSVESVNSSAAYGPTTNGSVFFSLHKDGSLSLDPFRNDQIPAWVPSVIVEKHGAEFAAVSLLSSLDTVLDTLLFLGCKNVSLAQRENDPEQVRRATKRFGPSATGYRYHVLVVRPPGARSDAPAQEIGNMPRHMCRGHFAEYGPEFGKGLLFGKYAGRFYVPPHLKGDARNGIVEKDYAIRAG